MLPPTNPLYAVEPINWNRFFSYTIIDTFTDPGPVEDAENDM